MIFLQPTDGRSRLNFQSRYKLVPLTIAAGLLLSHAVTASANSEVEIFSPTAVPTTPAAASYSAVRGMGYKVVSGHAVFEGDMVLGRVDNHGSAQNFAKRGLGLASYFTRWTNGIIPYQFSKALTDVEIAMAKEAINHWNENTSIKLVAITAENRSDFQNFVTFEASNGCSSYVGMRGGEQELWISGACGVGSIIHEIGHTVGLFHEHTRNDRDNFISVERDNIIDDAQFNFDVLDTGAMLLGEYDYGSIMHYGEAFFSINGAKTITVLDGVSEIGQRVALSEKDIASVDSLYATDVALNVSTATDEQSDRIRADVAVSNLGEMGSHQLTLILDADNDAQWTSISAGADWQCRSRTNQLLCTLSTLDAGASTTFSVIGAANDSSNTTVSAVLTTNTFDTDYSNNGFNQLLSADSNASPESVAEPDTGNDTATETPEDNSTVPKVEAAGPKATPMNNSAGGGALSPLALLILLTGFVLFRRNCK